MQVFQAFEYNLFHQNFRLINSLNAINDNVISCKDIFNADRSKVREEHQEISTNFLLLNEKLLLLQAQFEYIMKQIDKIDAKIQIIDS